MTKKKNDIEEKDKLQKDAVATGNPEAGTLENGQEEAAEEELLPSALEQLKQSVTEDDDAPTSSLTLSKILGGDILSAQMVRRQVWLCLLIALIFTVYVAFRYQCQQDTIDIAQLETQLVDAKYKALSSSSNLTERCRESRVLEMLRNNQDSLLQPSIQPPYKVMVPEGN